MSEGSTSDWVEITFAELATKLVNGGTPPTEVLEYWSGDIPWITGADFTDRGIGEIRRFVSSRALQRTATNKILAGELLLVTRTGVGKLAIAPFDVAISQDITSVYPDRRRADVRFLYYRMSQGVEELRKLNQGTSINGIVRRDLLSYRLKLPPKSEQFRIAEILSTVDDAIEQTEALIAKTQQVKAGLMHDLFSRGVAASGQLRPLREEAPELYKQSPLGWIPKEWDTRRLEDVATIDRGKFAVRPRNDPKYYGGSFPFIQTGDVAASTGRLLFEFGQALNSRGATVSREFPAGTIMVTIAANICDTCILGRPMYAPDSLVGVVPKVGEITRFLELCIRSRKAWLEKRAPQTAQKNINLEDLRPLLMCYPSKQEQLTMSQIYETTEASSRQLELQVAKLRSLKSALMHDLLTGRVRVPVPKSEP
jgi:type I restriction enzyme, S subunit